MSEIRTVFDTNGLVSAALLPHSTPRAALDAAIAHGRILISAATVDELNDVLARPKFDKYVTKSERAVFLATLIQEAELVEVSGAVAECRDPKDNKFLELCADGRAHYLVTGDDDLLVLDPFRGTRILTPKAFLDALA